MTTPDDFGKKTDFGFGKPKVVPLPPDMPANGHSAEELRRSLDNELEDKGPLSSKDQEILKRVFIPNWNNKPPVEEPTLFLKDTEILTSGGFSSIIAGPGAGKTSIGEAICAAKINNYADTLSFKVGGTVESILYIDTERTESEVWGSFELTAKRARIVQGDPMPNIIIAGLRNVYRLGDRKKAIELLITQNKKSLIFLDGCADLVQNINDIEESVEFTIWIREITTDNNCSCMATIHPNKGTFNPRGHQGAEMLRRSQTVLLARPWSNDISIITSDPMLFEHGKNRHTAPITTAYTWSREAHMFINFPIHGIEELNERRKDKLDAEKVEYALKIAKKVLPEGTSLGHNNLVVKIAKFIKKSPETGKRCVTTWTAWGIFLKREKDGNYQLNEDFKIDT